MTDKKIIGEAMLREITKEAAVDDYILIDLEADMSTLGGCIESVDELKITFAFMGVLLSLTPQEDQIVCSSPVASDTDLHLVARIDIHKMNLDQSLSPQKTDTEEGYDDSKLYL